jgi:hypothetical protein
MQTLNKRQTQVLILLRKLMFDQSVSEEKTFFYKSTNQKKEMHVAAMFVNGMGRNKRSL